MCAVKGRQGQEQHVVRALFFLSLMEQEDQDKQDEVVGSFNGKRGVKPQEQGGCVGKGSQKGQQSYVPNQEGIVVSVGSKNESDCINGDEVANANCHESNNPTDATFERVKTSSKRSTKSHANVIGADHDEGIAAKVCR